MAINSSLNVAPGILYETQAAPLDIDGVIMLSPPPLLLPPLIFRLHPRTPRRHPLHITDLYRRGRLVALLPILSLTRVGPTPYVEV